MDPRRASIMVPYGGIPLYNEYIPSSDLVFNMHNESEAAAAVIAEQITHHELQYSHHHSSYGYNQQRTNQQQEHMGNFVPTSEAHLTSQQYEVASLSAASRLLVEAVEDNSNDMIITTTDDLNHGAHQHPDTPHSIRVLHSARQLQPASSSSPDGTGRKRKRRKKNERTLDTLLTGEPNAGGSAVGPTQKVKKRKRSYTEKVMTRLQTLHRERMAEIKASREAGEKAHREKMATVSRLLQVLKKL